MYCSYPLFCCCRLAHQLRKMRCGTHKRQVPGRPPEKHLKSNHCLNSEARKTALWARFSGALPAWGYGHADVSGNKSRMPGRSTHFGEIVSREIVSGETDIPGITIEGHTAIAIRGLATEVPTGKHAVGLRVDQLFDKSSDFCDKFRSCRPQVFNFASKAR